MLTVLHTADFHLDAPFSGLPAERAALRRREQRDLLSRLAAVKADLVLIPGDLFDGQAPYRETLDAVREALRALAVPVFIAPGNHDYYTPHGAYGRVSWPDNVHIFTQSRTQEVALPALNCVVYGSAFIAPFREDDPLEGFRAPADGRVRLMCLHGDVKRGSRYGPIDPLRIAESGLDYLALGHVHSFDGVRRSGKTVWAYSGCPEGRGFDETGEKGALLCRLADGEAEVSFLPLCARRYEILELPAGADFEAVLPHGAQRDIYRILLTGETGSAGPDLTALTRLAEARFFFVEVQDHTRLSRDIWSRSEEDTLTGLFLRALRDKGDSDAAELAARFGLAALEHREDPF